VGTSANIAKPAGKELTARYEKIVSLLSGLGI
jgi:hypothetical protein